MKKINVLVFPCGAENASEIHAALTHSLHVNLFGASSVDDHGRFTFQQYDGDLPKIDSADFTKKFAALLRRWNIDLVFAAHDSVAAHLALLTKSLGFYLVNGETETTRITRRKSLTYAKFAGANWLPTVYSNVGVAIAANAWPILIKPDCGQGGQSITVVNDAAALQSACDLIPDPVICEYLPGQEITVDCFSDRNRKLVWVGARTRERIRAGISMRSQLLPSCSDVDRIATEINVGLVLRGPWFFQLKKDVLGIWKLLEISCRVAGTMVAQRARGVNLPLMAIHDYLGRDVKPLPEIRVGLIDRNISTLAALEFEFDTVFLDLDDTVIENGVAKPHIMSFIYGMKALKKRIVLITRHTEAVSQTLLKAHVAETLFDEIIQIGAAELKSTYVTPRAIFIDNHFPERLDVANRCGVPTFDVDTIALLAY